MVKYNLRTEKSDFTSRKRSMVPSDCKRFYFSARIRYGSDRQNFRCIRQSHVGLWAIKRLSVECLTEVHGTVINRPVWEPRRDASLNPLLDILIPNWNQRDVQRRDRHSFASITKWTHINAVGASHRFYTRKKSRARSSKQGLQRAGPER